MFIFSISLKINFLFNDSLICDGYSKIRWLETDNSEFLKVIRSFLNIQNKFKIAYIYILYFTLFLFYFNAKKIFKSYSFLNIQSIILNLQI